MTFPNKMGVEILVDQGIEVPIDFIQRWLTSSKKLSKKLKR